MHVWCGGAGEAATFERKWHLERGTRHVFFASDRSRDEDAVREGEEILSLEVRRGANADLFEVVKHDAWQRFKRAAAGVGADARDKAKVSKYIDELGRLMPDREYDREDESEGAMQDYVRRYITTRCSFEEKENTSAQLVQCVFAALPVVRAGGDPVFAVEAAGRDGWAVTSYFPEPLRHTAFANMPVRVVAESGLWYEVAVLATGAPTLRVVA